MTKHASRHRLGLESTAASPQGTTAVHLALAINEAPVMGLDGAPGKAVEGDTDREALFLPEQATPDAETLALDALAPDTAVASAVEVLPEADEDPAPAAALPTDPLFAEQWHLLNTDTGIDLNVVAVWADYDGSGVTIGIWDDGVQSDHPDLMANYDSSLHITLADGSIHDPYPQDFRSAHGTAVAGIIAAARNGIGVVGVAHGATIAGVDMFFDPALWDDLYTSQLKTFDVTNHSWGWVAAYGNSVFNTDPFWTNFHAGWHDSVIEGRGGLGTINVISAGNSRVANRTTSDQYMMSMPETIAVAAVGYDGFVSRYSTPGAAVVVSAPSNDDTLAGDPRIWTTDRTGDDGYSPFRSFQEPSLDPDYTGTFGGTSAAAPMVAGVVALMLEANPDLGWRDVQEILASTARHVGSGFGEAPQFDERFAWAFNGDSTWNLGGRHFSHDYGFGLTDAYAAVRVAETWTKQQVSGNWLEVEAATWSGDLYLPDVFDPTHQTVSLTLTSEEVMELETVAIELHFFDSAPDSYAITESTINQYLITLTSPSGMESTLTLPRNQLWQQSGQLNGSTINGKILMHSNAFRGEAAEGDWTLEITDLWGNVDGRLEFASLTFQGDEETPDDLFVFTEEFGDLAGGAFGHATHVQGGGGNDTVNTAAIASDTVLNLVTGEGMIDGVAVTGLGSIENAFTGDGNDVLIGGNGANVLHGGRGNDEIVGGNGPDELADGKGADIMTGGRGPDNFIITFDGDDDYILDFQDRVDTITFLGLEFADLSFGMAGSFVRIDATVEDVTDSLFVMSDGPRPLTLASFTEADFAFIA